jgi:hypothetical protein
VKGNVRTIKIAVVKPGMAPKMIPRNVPITAKKKEHMRKNVPTTKTHDQRNDDRDQHLLATEWHH